MILSKEFYDKCCLSYKKVIDNLEIDLADIDDSDDAIEIKIRQVLFRIITFSRSYLTPKEYWLHCLDLIELHKKDAFDFDTYKRFCCGIIKLAYLHLCCVGNWNALYFDNTYESTYVKPYADNYLKLDYFHCFSRSWSIVLETVMTERDLSYPHDMLQECLRQFERKTTKLPSTKLYKRYEEMLQLYPKIKAAIDDAEEWYQLLLQVGDNDYVKNNLEYRLGQDLHNVKLWKKYIGFLKENGEYKHLLGVYSKYCRLFLDDLEMKKEYEEAMRKYGPVNLPWKNLCDFEVHDGFGKEEERTQDSDSEVKEVSTFDKNTCVVFFKTRKRQNFSLPGALILYILENAGYRVLQKLFFSCKYFFAKHPTPICYSLHTGPDEMYEDESLTLRSSSKQESFPKNLYITGNLFIGIGRLSYRDVLPKFYRCEAKYIHLACPNLSFDELKFLIGHYGVIELNIYQCTIKDENGQFLDLEKIMALLPNIERLSLRRVKTNANTGHALAKQKFNSKISSINVHQILGKPFDAGEFLKFLVANKDDKQMFSGHFYFDNDFDAAFVGNLGRIISDYKKSRQYDFISASFDD